MTDKQQIEELRKFLSQLCCISNCDNCKWRSLEEGSCLDYFEAEALYNANYRRVADDEIVVKKSDRVNVFAEDFEELIRKETAKEFIFKVESYLGYENDNETFTKKELLLILAEVAKEQYGVEVEE